MPYSCFISFDSSKGSHVFELHAEFTFFEIWVIYWVSSVVIGPVAESYLYRINGFEVQPILWTLILSHFLTPAEWLECGEVKAMLLPVDVVLIALEVLDP